MGGKGGRGGRGAREEGDVEERGTRGETARERDEGEQRAAISRFERERATSSGARGAMARARSRLSPRSLCRGRSIVANAWCGAGGCVAGNRHSTQQDGVRRQLQGHCCGRGHGRVHPCTARRTHQYGDEPAKGEGESKERGGREQGKGKGVLGRERGQRLRACSDVASLEGEGPCMRLHSGVGTIAPAAQLRRRLPRGRHRCLCFPSRPRCPLRTTTMSPSCTARAAGPRSPASL